ncbi:unnamed protein product [Microthlaspi erraticum]|uniref:Uncharacterized protein n=1 Tax=Microthlaspi erraticum TaxID=1685480 RepID=A0A6D2IMZ9_9BRAS|nr:unnamed protein product [Microthlaspi erraticum]
MLGESSSEEADDKKSDNESDYDACESSDDINGDEDDADLANKEKSTMITRRRKPKDDDPVIISISETAKLRKRKSEISSIQAPIVPTNLVGPLLKRKRDSVRLPTKKFKDRIVGSPSSSSSSSSSIPTQMNVNGGTMTTTSSSSESSSQDSIFRSSLGSNNTRASSVNPSSSVHAQPSSSVVSLPQHYRAPQARAMQRSSALRQQRPYVPILPYDPNTQANIARRAPQARARQRPHGSRQLRPLLPTPQATTTSGNNPNPNAFQGYTQAQMEAMKRSWQSLLSNLHGRSSVDSSLVPSFQEYITRPSSTVNIHRPISVSGPLPSATLSHVLGSSSSSSLEAQANAIRGCNSGLLPAMPNDQQQQQQHHPSSSSSMDVRGLDLNLPANNEDGGEKEDEGFDLNQPAPDE